MSRADAALAVAVAAVVLAVLLGLAVLRLWLTVRRMRRAQRLVLATDTHDLVEYAVGLLARVEATEGRAAEVERLVAVTASRLQGCLQRTGLVRYDALEGAGGRQSASVAMLDDAGAGLVLSAIQGRDYARIYLKQVDAGAAADLELSPEERAAIDQALQPAER